MLTEFRLETDAEVVLQALTLLLDAVAGVSSNPQSISNRFISFTYIELREKTEISLIILSPILVSIIIFLIDILLYLGFIQGRDIAYIEKSRNFSQPSILQYSNL
jgi:hypothetical protein